MCVRTGGANGLLLLAAGTLLLIVFLVWSLSWPGTGDRRAHAGEGHPLTVYCAAGIRLPVQAVVEDYERECGGRVALQFGGSGTLLSNIDVVKVGDLYVAGDDGYIRLARAKGLVQESIALARLRPVLAVRKGNPKGITRIEHLLREDVTLALANPDAAAVGEATRVALSAAGCWEAVNARTRVFKPTVNEVANDIKIGAVDAGIIWDATANRYDEIEAVKLRPLDGVVREVTVGVLSCGRMPTQALHFARYLGARDRGLRHFARSGFEPVQGDVWAERPELLLMSGAMLNPAVDATIKRFEEREGVRITRIYNGCGILLAQMRTGARPDAYFSCDVSFMAEVKELFLDPENVSENRVVMLVQRGNPRKLAVLEDLLRPGLRVGLAHPEKSALGALTRRILEGRGLDDRLRATGNLKVESPTGDFLVNQLRAGSLDAVCVYRSNAAAVLDHAAVIPIEDVRARAVQPYAVGRRSPHQALMRRLLDAIRAETSRQRFEALGFRWLAGPDHP